MTRRELIERLQNMLDFKIEAGANRDDALDNFEEQIEGFINDLTPDEKFKAWLKREKKMHKNAFYRIAVWVLDRLHDHYDIAYTIETW